MEDYREATQEEDRMMRGTVASVLFSKACQRINFTVWKWAINATGYRLVADKLKLTGADKKISFMINSSKPEWATYDPGKNVFTFGRADFGPKNPVLGLSTERAVILHESTHAVLDAIDKNGALNGWHSEVAAFLAEAYFRMFDAQDAQHTRQLQAQRSPTDKSTHISAMAIVGAAIRTFGSEFARFETKDVLSLINVMRAEPHYEKAIKKPLPAGNNGI